MNKIAVTGADGFIGSHLVENLVRNGYEIKALSYYNSFGTWGWLDALNSDVMQNVEVVTGDVRDYTLVNSLIKDTSAVFHLAALIGIPYSYVAPKSYIDTNITGTFNVLEAAKNNKVDRILTTSTSEVYGSAKYIPIDELHPLQGQSPYSASKIGADKITEAYYRSFDLPVTIVRPFNTFGPRQSQRAIIPTIIQQLLSGTDIIKLGNLDARRDFNYVKDTANGFYEIYKATNTIGEEINIATKEEISMKGLAEELISIINPQARIEIDKSRIRPSKSEVNRLLGDNSKILELTEWQQTYSLSEGLSETIEWFRTQSSTKADKYMI